MRNSRYKITHTLGGLFSFEKENQKSAILYLINLKLHSRNKKRDDQWKKKEKHN